MAEPRAHRGGGVPGHRLRLLGPETAPGPAGTPGARHPRLAREGGNRANVERRLAQFPPWTGEVLTIDAVQPLVQNLAAVLQYVTD